MPGGINDVIAPCVPRKGHLDQVLHIFAYLHKYHNTELVYDPSDPVVEYDVFKQRDWTSSKFGAVQGKEEIPSNMPEPRGLGFTMRVKVDADHASDMITRRDFGLLELCTDILVEQEAKFHGVIILWVQVHSNKTML